MLQIQSYLYQRYRPEIVELKDMDMIDYGQRILAEAGDISGASPASRFTRFLGSKTAERQPRNWKFIHNPYDCETFKIYKPTEELLECLHNFQEGVYDEKR
jgi:hypothetical protein